MYLYLGKNLGTLLSFYLLLVGSQFNQYIYFNYSMQCDKGVKILQSIKNQTSLHHPITSVKKSSTETKSSISLHPISKRCVMSKVVDSCRPCATTLPVSNTGTFNGRLFVREFTSNNYLVCLQIAFETRNYVDFHTLSDVTFFSLQFVYMIHFISFARTYELDVYELFVLIFCNWSLLISLISA